jgi:hypothetical protein
MLLGMKKPVPSTKQRVVFTYFLRDFLFFLFSYFLFSIFYFLFSIFFLYLVVLLITHLLTLKLLFLLAFIIFYPTILHFSYNHYRHATDVMGAKSRARGAAFRLLLLIIRGEISDDRKNPAKASNAALSIVSHPGTSK